MFNTIWLNRPYALRAFALSRLLDIDGASDLDAQKGAIGLRLRTGAMTRFRRYLADYARNGAYIDFANEKDWIAYLGNPEASPSTETALEYYVNKGDVAAAIATKKKTARSAKEVEEFQDMIVSEKAVRIISRSIWKSLAGRSMRT